MKKIMLVSILLLSVLFSKTILSATSKPRQSRVIYKKIIKGKIIYTNLLGYRLQRLGPVKLKKPNILTIELRDVSIADADSKLLKKVVYKNVSGLPFEYSINVEGIKFIRRYTYALSVLLDVNMDNKYSVGNFYNSRRMRVPIDTTAGNIVIKNIYIGRKDR